MLLTEKIIEKPIQGMESIGLMREVVVSDEKLAEQASVLQSNFNNIQEEMSDREFNPNLLALRDLNVENEDYDLLNKYIYGLVPILSTKKMLFECGIRFDNSELDFASTMFLNKDLQSILPQLMREFFISFKDAIKNGTYLPLYGAMCDVLAEDLQAYTPYKYETVKDTMTPEEYDDFIDSKVEDITDRMYKTLFTMGILIYHNGVDEAKTELKELFRKYGVDFDSLIDFVTPEQLISEPSQFHGMISQVIRHKEEIKDAITPHVNEISVEIDRILRELGDKNSLSKFNQGNNMMGNIYPTINICELIAMTILSISKEIRTVETEEELSEGAKSCLEILRGIVSEKLSSKEVNLNITLDSVDIKLLSAPAMYVNDIVAKSLSLRAVDGSFQSLCSSIMNSIGGLISELLQEEQNKIKDFMEKSN